MPNSPPDLHLTPIWRFHELRHAVPSNGPYQEQKVSTRNPYGHGQNQHFRRTPQLPSLEKRTVTCSTLLERGQPVAPVPLIQIRLLDPFPD